MRKSKQNPAEPKSGESSNLGFPAQKAWFCRKVLKTSQRSAGHHVVMGGLVGHVSTNTMGGLGAQISQKPRGRGVLGDPIDALYSPTTADTSGPPKDKQKGADNEDADAGRRPPVNTN